MIIEENQLVGVAYLIVGLRQQHQEWAKTGVGEAFANHGDVETMEAIARFALQVETALDVFMDYEQYDGIFVYDHIDTGYLNQGFCPLLWRLLLEGEGRVADDVLNYVVRNYLDLHNIELRQPCPDTPTVLTGTLIYHCNGCEAARKVKIGMEKLRSDLKVLAEHGCDGFTFKGIDQMGRTYEMMDTGSWFYGELE